MEPNFSLEPNALRFIYTEKLVVFQDARDSLLRELDFNGFEEAELEATPTATVAFNEQPINTIAELPTVVSDQTIAVPDDAVLPKFVEAKQTETKPVNTITKPSLIVHGANKRNILVLLPGLKTELTTEERDFLLKIMASKQLKGNDIGFVFENENRAISTKADLLASKPQLVIAFGVKYNFLAFLPSRSYSLIAEDGVLYLKSDSLLKLTSDTNIKKLLWSQLQPLVLA